MSSDTDDEQSGPVPKLKATDYTCPEDGCYRSFHTEQGLEYHLERWHNGDDDE